jgi:acyl carrier protein
MPKEFKYDVFLSHNSKDKARVRRLAEQLRAAGLRVWFDEWIIQPGDDIYLAIEQGLEAARVQVLCLSPATLGSGWTTMERSTVLFRSPTNSERRFIPLLLADCELPDTLRRYKYVDFRQDEEAAFKELLTACRVPAKGTPEISPNTLRTARPRLIERLFRKGLFRRRPAESVKTLLVRKPAKPVVLERKLEVDVQAIENKVIEIASEQMGVDKSEITRDTSFINDLNADSLDTMQLVMEFEDEFDMSMPDEEAEKIQTVGDAVDYIVNIAQTKEKEST